MFFWHRPAAVRFLQNKSANEGALIFIVTLFGSVLIIAYHPPFVQRFLRSAWLSVNARLDRRRNNIAGRAILKANLERTVLAVLLNPNQRDNANPKKMSRKSGELFPN